MKNSRLRDPLSAITHLAGAIAAAGGLFFMLLANQRGPAAILPIVVYGIGMFALFSASATYHAIKAGPETIQILRKFDHSAIYILIAASYTPFCAIAFSGFWRWGLLAIIWGLAVIGIVVKIFYIRSPRWLTAGLYVAMGWVVIFAIQEMLRTLSPQSLIWLLVGGIIYTAGAVVYSTKKLDLYPGVFGFHEVWHIFVLLGAIAHYIAIFTLISVPG